MTLSAVNQPRSPFSRPLVRGLFLAVPVLAVLVTLLAAPGFFLGGFALCANAFTGWLTARGSRMYQKYSVELPAGNEGAALALFLGLFVLVLLGLGLFIFTGRRAATIRYRRSPARAAAAPLAGLLAFALLLAVLGGAATAGKQPLAALLQSARGGIEQLRYQRTAPNNLPEGNLVGLRQFEANDTPALELVMDKPESLYLRGYVGSHYTGQGWEESAGEALADYSDLFYWLHQDGFYGQTQMAGAAALLDEEMGPASQINLVVNNLNANSKYLYVPYELTAADPALLDPRRLGDERLASPGLGGTRNYRLATLPNQVKRYPELLTRLYEAEQTPSDELEAYLTVESHYNEFVYDQYLQLPQSDRRYLAEKLGSFDTEGEPHLPYQQAKQAVLSALTGDILYSESVSAIGPLDDFLPHFFETGEGFSVHYATAAALMFRYYGIPARYVEGYLVTPGDVEGLLANTAIRLDGTHGHAWCEIYHDGLGWVPFEVTPPYLNLMEQPDHFESIDTGSTGDEPENSPQREMTLDNYEEEAPEYQMTDAGRWLRALAIGAAVLLVLLALGWYAWRLARGRRALKRQARRFGLDENGDYSMAVRHLYAYMERLYQAAGAHPVSAPPAGVKAIYHLARYAPHPVSAGQCGEVRAFKDALLAELRRALPGRKRFYCRYIAFIF